MTHTPEVFRLPLAIPFWIVFFIGFMNENRILFPAFREKRTGQDGGTFRVIMVASPLSMFAAFSLAWQARFAIPAPFVAAISGTILIAVGAALRQYCFATLGKSFTGVVIVRPDQQVIQTGPYRYIRHPSYTAAMLMFIGVGFALGNWLGLAILIFAHGLVYVLRVAAEEKALVATIGSAYSDYMSRTKRFIPFVL